LSEEIVEGRSFSCPSTCDRGYAAVFPGRLSMACTLRPFDLSLELPFFGIASGVEFEIESGFGAWLVVDDDDDDEGIGWSLANPK
jgi:hypothetical protein